MSTLRQDPTTRQWSILAPRRGARPHEPVVVPRPTLGERDDRCPFCPGNEDQTPPEIDRLPREGAWAVRVVPNMYAALSGDGSVSRTGPPLFREMPGVGSHEVVIESPRHDARLDEMAVEDVARVVEMWRIRYRALIALEHIQAVVVFKNFGPLAGTSLVHTHSQVVATPVFLPRLLRQLDVEDVEDLAGIIKDVLRAIRIGCGDPDYNLVMFSAPSNGRTDRVFHWHIKVVPKLATPAGFELGSAMSINIEPPERAAEVLREALA